MHKNLENQKISELLEGSENGGSDYEVQLYID